MDSDPTKLFVGGISRETSEDTLKEYFGKYGTVLSSVIATDRVTRNPRGFGFVSFSNSSSADKALVDSHVILGRKVEVKRAIPRGEPKNHQESSGLGSGSNSNGNNKSQIRTRKIFVGGLSSSLTEEDFKKYFEQFGRITDVVVMHDSTTQRPRGFGFITFDSEDSVENVMQNSFHELNSRLVEVKRAVPKEESGCNGGYLIKKGSGRGLPNNSYTHPGNYIPYNPRFGLPPSPSFAPFPGYTSPEGFIYGANGYGGWHPFGGFGVVSYGVAPISPVYGPGINGFMAPVFPYGGASFYPAYANGSGGGIGLAAGANNGIVRPSFSGKWNQFVTGVGHGHADSASRWSEGDNKPDVDSASSKSSNGTGSSRQSQRCSDG